MFQLDYNKPSSSNESDFTTAADSATRHLLLSPMDDSCYVVYQLLGTIRFPFLQGFQHSLVAVTPLHSTPQPFHPPSHVLMVAHCECGESLWKRF